MNLPDWNPSAILSWKGDLSRPHLVVVLSSARGACDVKAASACFPWRFNPWPSSFLFHTQSPTHGHDGQTKVLWCRLLIPSLKWTPSIRRTSAISSGPTSPQGRLYSAFIPLSPVQQPKVQSTWTFPFLDSLMCHYFCQLIGHFPPASALSLDSAGVEATPRATSESQGVVSASFSRRIRPLINAVAQKRAPLS